jgi:hypothetical protein
MFGTNHGQVVSKTPFGDSGVEVGRSEVMDQGRVAQSREGHEGSFFKCYDITDFNSASYVTSLVNSDRSNAKDVGEDNTWDKITFERKEEAVH